MSARLPAILTALAGVAVLVVFYLFTALPTSTAAAGCDLQPKVIAFELARTQAELTDVFGAPGSTCHDKLVTGMDGINHLDLAAFIPSYTFFCAIASVFMARRLRAPFAIAGILAALVACAGDIVETRGLLALTPHIDNTDPNAVYLPEGAWTKFWALAVNALILGVIGATAPHKRNILGALCLAPSVGTAIAFFDHTRAPLMSAAYFLAWTPILVMAIKESIAPPKA